MSHSPSLTSATSPTRPRTSQGGTWRMLLAMANDLRVVLLRLASRLQTLRYFAANKLPGSEPFARETLVPALGLAVATGAFVALYTTYDAYGIRATADPFTFLAWFFLIDGVLFPLVFARRLLTVPRAEWRPMLRLGLFGAVIAYLSFGSIMLATRLCQMSAAARTGACSRASASKRRRAPPRKVPSA